MMNEIHAKPIIDGKLWMVEQNGVKIATLHKKENNKFLLTNKSGHLWFDKKEELVAQFGGSFFLIDNSFKVPAEPEHECYGFPTMGNPHNVMYDVRKKLPMFTTHPTSKCFHCAGWYAVKVKNWSIAFCPKLITVERYEAYGPFKTKEEAINFKCTK